jgi:hypothetical protein
VSENENKLCLSLKRAQTEVDIEDEAGKTTTYLLKEMTGTQRDQYVSNMMKRTKFDGEGKILQMGDITGMQASLISMCLYDPQGQLVPPTFINAMPATSQNLLFEACSRLNGLDKGAETSSKNG